MRPLVRALAVVLALSGCSAIFVNKPEGRPPPGAPLNCTESRIAPWIDASVAALSVLLAVGIGAQSCEEGDCIVQSGAAIPLAGFAIGYGSASIWGHSAVTECRDLKNPRPAPPPSATQPGLDWKPVVVGAAGLEVHSGAANVTPIVANLPPGTAVSVRASGVEGWVVVQLPDGRAGYARSW